MDPYELLKADHKKVSDLFSQIESASGNAKTNLFKKIRDELELHTHIEEKIFYPALENTEAARDLTLEAYEEHKAVKRLLGELDQSQPGDEWDAKLKVLRENVEHHVDEEEGELFDKAQDVLSDEEADRLGERMQNEKRRVGGEAAVAEPQQTGLIAAVKQALGLGKSPKAKAAASKRAQESAKKGRGDQKSSKTAPKSSKVAAKRKSSSKKSGSKKAAKAKAGKKKTTKAGARKKVTSKKSGKKRGAKQASRR
jgi:iron-sulfur cluster repair protein YtfE (RIC family)